MLIPEVQHFASRSILCWLATVSANGQANVSPKEVFAVFDTHHLVIANIASPTSVRNIEVNPLVCVSFIDVFVQKGFKVMGTARSWRNTESEFAHWSAPLLAKAGTRFPIHSVIVVKASAVEPILAPSYRLYAAETSEESQVASAMRAYGVQPDRGDASSFAQAECQWQDSQPKP
ncbi:MAG: pyridoxamine 5'-phosphate oxidase family protein [Gammaproteobacteria bacterium]|nr:pyridoxamine 5'-phosphate oxidase family protein [Gammaproteobacteria bacterium]